MADMPPGSKDTIRPGPMQASHDRLAGRGSADLYGCHVELNTIHSIVSGATGGKNSLKEPLPDFICPLCSIIKIGYLAQVYDSFTKEK